jgi:hypothetical protein
MILDRLKSIETDVDTCEIIEVCNEFDDEIKKINIKKEKHIYIHIKIIDRIKNCKILKNLKFDKLSNKSKGYDIDEEKTIKTFKSRLK